MLMGASVKGVQDVKFLVNLQFRVLRANRHWNHNMFQQAEIHPKKCVSYAARNDNL